MIAEEARTLAARELAASLPRRWQHVQAVGARAEQLAVTLPPDDAGAVVAAAWLHDIGYGPGVADTGFHPLDGARYLRRLGIDERIVALVAHHSCAELEADERGLGKELAAEFLREESPASDLLWYCDMTTGPDGQKFSIDDRLREIRSRYTPGDPVYRFIVRADSRIREVVSRAEERLRAASAGGGASEIREERARPKAAARGQQGRRSGISR